MAKLAYHVPVEDEHGEIHIFGPDDALPAWAAKKITNPSAWDGDEVPAAVAKASASAADSGSQGAVDSGSGDSDTKPYAKWKKADLEAEVARRNEGRDDDDVIEVEGAGTVADLAAALDGDDAAQAG